MDTSVGGWWIVVRSQFFPFLFLLILMVVMVIVVVVAIMVTWTAWTLDFPHSKAFEGATVANKLTGSFFISICSLLNGMT